MSVLTNIHLRFIAILKLPFKFSPDHRACSDGGFRPRDRDAGVAARGEMRRAMKKGEAFMADIELAAIGEPDDADRCFEYGMIHSAGAGVPVDLIEAHKWFNIAVMQGHPEAARLRREIAEQMSDGEIGRAQRAARDWLKSHPQRPAPTGIRVAA
jgi:hypothetical protein